MGKSLGVMILCVYYLFSSSFTLNEKGCEVFLSLSETKKVSVYATTKKGKIIKSVGHDFANEDYLSFTIHNSNDSMYQVTALQSISGKQIDGWISKQTKISIFYKGENTPIILYKLPKENSSAIKADYTSNELLVLDCKKNWLKVKTKRGKVNITGWIPEELQCSNPYTSCN